MILVNRVQKQPLEVFQRCQLTRTRRVSPTSRIHHPPAKNFVFSPIFLPFHPHFYLFTHISTFSPTFLPHWVFMSKTLNKSSAVIGVKCSVYYSKLEPTLPQCFFHFLRKKGQEALSARSTLNKITWTKTFVWLENFLIWLIVWLKTALNSLALAFYENLPTCMPIIS